MNDQLLDKTIERLEAELKKAKELKKKFAAKKKPVPLKEVKKVIDSIKAAEQTSSRQYVEATEQATEAPEDDDDNEQEDTPMLAAGIIVSTPAASTADYVPPPEEDEGGEEEEQVALPPSKKRKRGDSNNPFKDKAIENKTKAISGRMKNAEGQVRKNPFAHLKNAEEFFEQTVAPQVPVESADGDALLEEGSKTMYYPTIVPNAALSANPVVEALSRNNFNVAKTIPDWLESNVSKAKSFSELANDFRLMHDQLAHKNAALKMTISAMEILEKYAQSVHEFTANAGEITEVKNSLTRDINDKKAPKDTLRVALSHATSVHSKALVEACFNAIMSGKK